MTYLRDGEAFRTMPDGSVVKLDKDEVIRDGQRIHVPLYLADASKPGTQAAPVDAANARPRYGVMTDAQRVQSDVAHHRMVKRTSNAWKKDATILQHEAKRMVAPQMHSQHSNTEKIIAEQMAAPDTNDPNAAYDRMRARQENAWKGAKTKTV